MRSSKSVRSALETSVSAALKSGATDPLPFGPEAEGLSEQRGDTFGEVAGEATHFRRSFAKAGGGTRGGVACLGSAAFGDTNVCFLALPRTAILS